MISVTRVEDFIERAWNILFPLLLLAGVIGAYMHIDPFYKINGYPHCEEHRAWVFRYSQMANPNMREYEIYLEHKRRLGKFCETQS